MAGKTRHYFPGNNTPQGFFSYYRYILEQREAQKIYCLKGGPGLGKSTFMRQIGEELVADGEDVDFLHCSSDPHSLDGILLRGKKIAMVDGTSPHIVDPVHPGAVDTILHLGDYWDEAGIRQNRQLVLDCGDALKEHYARAYGYLGAAGKLHESLHHMYDTHLNTPELYKKAASIINRELTHKKLSPKPGRVRKQFASALTPDGCVNYISSLMADAAKIYLIEEPAGMSGDRLIRLFLESALYRGYDAECFYCSMDPSDKPEHLYIPQIKTAFVSSNSYHPLDASDFNGKVTSINLHRMLLIEEDSAAQAHIGHTTKLMEELIDSAFRCFREAKAQHDQLEQAYIPNMDFSRLLSLQQDILAEIRSR